MILTLKKKEPPVKRVEVTNLANGGYEAVLTGTHNLCF